MEDGKVDLLVAHNALVGLFRKRPRPTVRVSTKPASPSRGAYADGQDVAVNSWLTTKSGMPGVLEPSEIEGLTASAYDADVPIFLTQGSFVKGSTSAHAGGGTYDIRIRNLTEEQIARLTRALEIHGYAVYRPGPSVPGYTGPHLHVVNQLSRTLNALGVNQAMGKKAYVVTTT